MDNQKKPTPPHDDGWFDEILAEPEVGVEIGPDEQAVSAAGLTHPADMELERIINETKSMDDDDISLLELQDDNDISLPELQGDEDTLPPELQDDTSLPEPEGDNDTLLPELQDVPSTEEVYPADLEDVLIPLEAQMDEIIPEYEDEIPAQPAPEPEKKPEPPVRKARPRMKKGYGLFGIPHILATVIWLAITVAIGVSLGRTIWVCAADVLAFGREDKELTITITDSDNIDTIASKLKNVGLIKYPGLFKMYAELTGAEEEIAPGTFTLNSLYDYHALVNSMTPHASSREEVEVLIPEGYTCAQIFALLEEKKVCTVEELELYAATGELDDYWFLEGVTRGEKYSLEGYLFPDTYRFYLNDDPENVLEKMLDNFDYRFTDLMKEKIEPLNARMASVLASRGYSAEYIDAHKFTIREIVIIASMIERETANDAESFDISSVIYNRLTNPGSYPYLNIDATLIYALGGNIDPETGETMPLSKADLEMDHPYNSYTKKGLIPGPISNPGRASLLAALDPNETNYYFYVYNPNAGVHKFAKTPEEHEKNVASVRSSN